ncbi:unnamed protein product [Brassicogethes aeneus]|uniref:Uncharacterized protein n=1 Tax=Brassicogethes aeneus TaxID=1431903 RepID=A0A9P0AM35_BRAAE|nr:unnamed protein product [Brassicogethes aeneus]
MSDNVNITLKNVVTVTDGNSKNCGVAQEVDDIREVLKSEHNKYLKYKIINDTIQELIGENSSLDSELKAKAKEILLNSQCSQSVIIDKNSTDKGCHTVFGIGDSSVELTYFERDSLKNSLERRLSEKCIHLDFSLSENNLNSKKCPTFQLVEDDQILIDLKEKLKNEQKLYIENLFKKHEILNEIKNLRLTELPKIVDEKHTESVSLCKMNEVKSEILFKKVRVDIFSESNISLEAYKQFIADLKNQQKECQMEIDDILDLKEKYKIVACKQYNDILKSYLQYRASNEKKKMLYDCMI